MCEREEFENGERRSTHGRGPFAEPGDDDARWENETSAGLREGKREGRVGGGGACRTLPLSPFVCPPYSMYLTGSTHENPLTHLRAWVQAISRGHHYGGRFHQTLPLFILKVRPLVYIIFIFNYY